MRHQYAVDARERDTIPLYIAAAAIVSAIAVGKLFAAIQWTPPSWVDAPSTIGLYGLYYQLFRRSFWKTTAMRRLSWVKTPDLNGKWNGFVSSSHDGHQIEHPVEVSIKQDWTHISIVLTAANSESCSLLGSILTGDQPELSYEYLNEPRSGAVDTMHTHRGMARLRIREDLGALDGDYYSGRDRTTSGSIHLTKQAAR